MSVSADSLPLRHVLLAVVVMAIWGTNFVVIRLGLDHLPPLTFAALRFATVFLPAAFFIPRPPVQWRYLAAYGLLIGGGQFGLLFIAMNGHITPALASLVVQMQVFFTIGLAAAISGERVRPYQLVALAIAAVGLVLIIAHTDAVTTPLGLALVLTAALCWSGGNIVIRSSPGVDMLGYVVWASPFSVIPLVAAALLIEGPHAMIAGLASADRTTWAAVVWQAVGNTMFGYAVWGWLLSRYPVASVTPMALLIPLFGIGASALWLGESMQPWKLEAMGLVLLGLFLNVMWPKISAVMGARAERGEA